jgi:AraC-like DNA-binding protein
MPDTEWESSEYASESQTCLNSHSEQELLRYWQYYMTKRPLPTYAERLKEIEKKVHEWKRHKHYRQHGLKMRDVAEQLGISTVNLSNYVNTVEGMNFSAWLNSLRVEDAKKLMQTHPELSIYDIGYKVGHPHPNTFKKAFITITGQTPDEWRKENVASDGNE